MWIQVRSKDIIPLPFRSKEVAFGLEPPIAALSIRRLPVIEGRRRRRRRMAVERTCGRRREKREEVCLCHRKAAVMPDIQCSGANREPQSKQPCRSNSMYMYLTTTVLIVVHPILPLGAPKTTFRLKDG